MVEILLFLIAAVLHECGHLIAAGILGIRLISLRQRAIGAAMQYDFSSCGYLAEAVVHISGAFLNILSACIAWIMYESVAYFFCGISVTLAFVNLLPIKGFDGGGVARCILACCLKPDIVWRVCCILSGIGICLLWTAVLWIEMRCGGNLALIVFVLFVMLGQIE